MATTPEVTTKTATNDANTFPDTPVLYFLIFTPQEMI
jgi:hypothetical protein